MKTITNSQKIKDILERGIEQIIDKNSLLRKLKTGRKLRIKHGIDPTGPRIHIGRAVQFRKLRSFQDLGHKIILIIGDFTAQIGDASDKQSMRRPLTEKEVKENMKDYREQIGKILNLKKTEIRYNSQWLNKLTIKELLSLAVNFSAQQMIQRRSFKERWEQGKPIGLHELTYPLFQGYDSFAVKADLEIGGADQLFNLKIGREIQKTFGQAPQDILTSKMLSGLDGRKMSTSWDNMVTIVDKPNEMYGKIMSMKDEFIPEYFELCTDVPLSEVKNIKRDLLSKKVNPRDLKARLAREIISVYYNKKQALKSEKEFDKVFKEKRLPDSIPTIKIPQESLNILELLFKTKLTSSKAQAKRLVIQKGVKINNEIQTDWQKQVKIKKGLVIQVGKRKFAKIA
ncbi:MAG: tyrosine--tRNA ligase [Candidatus Nealsonbacteria bacterium RBG_13_38_11]|uniref:Tyrosine--tRNA ligase n=1 Tax=Candidatus Nealsonbacteria bacterium RBG_13_38_11 TaxID=1801662 RepID=A0A1G2DZN9_9BACT|nr:MAG: tyrosine--tRNA ligase [Candidatus Nealsonbacteria bacterium RBG_13_38_11]